MIDIDICLNLETANSVVCFNDPRARARGVSREPTNHLNNYASSSKEDMMPRIMRGRRGLAAFAVPVVETHAAPVACAKFNFVTRRGG